LPVWPRQPGGYTGPMGVSSLVARPLLAGMFVHGGLDAVRNPGGKVARAEKVAPEVAGLVGIDADTEQLVQFNGAVQVAAGITLALGIFPRLSALALAGSLVPTTLAGHRFWEEEDDAARAQQTIQFLKNLGMLGGLLLIVEHG
jgi:putative oxidoreductase